MKSVVGVPISAFALAIIATLGGYSMDGSAQSQDLPTSAPMTTDSAGKAGALAALSVVRVVCPSTKSGGTGFLHRSGKIITAEHVVTGCTDALVQSSSSTPLSVAGMITDAKRDLALLTLQSPLEVKTLPISQHRKISIGAQVSTWGFPAGYKGRAPLLAVGYMAGLDKGRMVVNAAFNSGNSGGPLIDLETGAVIGVVASKLAPMPAEIESAIAILSKQTSGLMYTATHSDGTTEQFTEGQVVAKVLDHLRTQVQLVVGMAVTLKDLRAFLESKGIEP